MNPDDPSALGAAERFHEIAAILARGVLRLRKCPKSEEVCERAHEGLDVSAESRLNGTEGLTP